MLEKLTLGDLADIEDVTGLTMNGVDLSNPPMKFALALYWVIKRRDDAKFSYADARNTPVTELAEFQAALKGEDPTTAPPPGSPVEAEA